MNFRGLGNFFAFFNNARSIGELGHNLYFVTYIENNNAQQNRLNILFEILLTLK